MVSTLIIAVLAAATFAAFMPVLDNGFVNYDDPGYVTENPAVRSGLTTETIAWSFTKFHQSNWHPLTWLSHALDVTLFGVDPAAHHGMNLFLHTLATILLFVALRSLTGDHWKSAVVALLFGIHPLHVESVAWVSERKDVLSALFLMLTLLAYAGYARKGGKARYGLTLVLYALGLMAKPMLVTLPFLLLLLDFWPLNRFNPSRPAGRKDSGGAFVRGRLFTEKVPFIILAAASSVVTFIAQERGGSIAELGPLPFSQRLGNTLVSYMEYLWKTLVPTDLAFFYPYPAGGIEPWKIVMAIAVLGGVSVAVWNLRRRAPYLLTGWLWYAGTLFPVIGLVQVGLQAMADRYMYIPMIGLGVMVAWGIPALLANRPGRGLALTAAVSVCGFFMIVATRVQAGHWKDNGTLYGHALAVTRGNHIAHANLGVALSDAGKDAEAISHFREALRLWPMNLHIRSNLARSLASVGLYTEALGHYRVILPAVRPDPRLHFRMGEVLAEMGRLDEAAGHYRSALDLDSANIDVLCSLADLYSRQSRFQEARELCARVFRVRPGSSRAHDALGVIAGRQGFFPEAEEEFRKAIAADTADAQAYVDLGVLFERTGESDEAIGMYRRALRADPSHELAHSNLGMALARKGDFGEAESEWRRGVELNPYAVNPRMNLGRLYSVNGRPAEAIAQYETVLRLDSANANVHLILGNLLEAGGNTGRAMFHFREALRYAPGLPGAVEALERLGGVTPK